MKLRQFFKRIAEKIKGADRMRVALWISGVSMIIALSVLMTTVTTAWIKRDWSTSVYEDKIKIETNGSLALVLEGGGTAQNAISILDQLGLKEITLKPVSNLTGTSDGFFLLNKETAGDEFFEHLVPADMPSQRTQVGIANGFIEFRITLLGEDVVQKTDVEGIGGEATTTYIKYIYLKNDSYFCAYDEDIVDGLDPSEALRVSITPGKSYSGQTLVFRNPIEGVAAEERLKHTGINSTKIDNVWIANGAPYWNANGAEAETFRYHDEDYDIVQWVQAHQLSDYDGGITTDENGVRHIDPTKCICNFSSSDQETLTIRIWIEGTDRICTDDIAGMKLKLFLNFEAVNCIDGKIIELDAEDGPAAPTP